MTPEAERAYIDGTQAAWRRMLGEAIRALGPEGSADSWRLERAGAVHALRVLCAEFGDNEWDDSLDLMDVIDKHLSKHLYSVLR